MTNDKESDRGNIKTRAYEIWESEGRPDGQHLDHWQQAEQEAALGEQESKDAAERRPVAANEAEQSSAPPSTAKK